MNGGSCPAIAPAGTRNLSADIVSGPSPRPFPQAIYQFYPHSSFSMMTAVLPRIAAAGFDAVQMPPIHPPGITAFTTADGATKLGSAYAPRNFMSVSPCISNDRMRPDMYLERGDGDSKGWRNLRRFVSRAREAGLRVVADLVLGHTAADPDVIERYEKIFGKEFYKRGEDGSIERLGAYTEGGVWSEWLDIVPIDHAGPAHERIEDHFSGLLNRFMESGVSVFRADDAPRISGDFWRVLLGRARSRAAKSGLPLPRFYAEAMSTVTDQDLNLFESGFDVITDSLRWWDNFSETWFVERANDIQGAGGKTISFASSHDTETFAATFGGAQERLTRLALTALLSSSFFVMEGTLSLAERQPSVFLGDHQRWTSHARDDFGEGTEEMRKLMSILLGIKKRYEIFHSHGDFEIARDGDQIAVITKRTDSEEALFAINSSAAHGIFNVPRGFRRGCVFGTNNRWFGPDSSDGPIHEYGLDPGGMAVFYSGFAGE